MQEENEALRREWETVKACDHAMGVMGATSAETRELHSTSYSTIVGAAAQLGVSPRALADCLDNGRLADLILAATYGARPLIYEDPGEAVEAKVAEVVRWADQEHRRIIKELTAVEKQFAALKRELRSIGSGRRVWEIEWQTWRERVAGQTASADVANPGGGNERL